MVFLQSSLAASLSPDEIRGMIRREVEKAMKSANFQARIGGGSESALVPGEEGMSASMQPQRGWPSIRILPPHKQKRILVTGGSGFVGSHLVDKLMKQGHKVFVLDNFFTGRQQNVQHWVGHPNFQLLIHDVVMPINGVEIEQIYHLASPASPPHYQFNPIKTIKTNTRGTLNVLGLAKRVGARVLLASTSEVYGDPEVHPQPESYWGHVNPIGPRACYDEAKRVAETMMYAYQKQAGIEVRVARIFNTFGDRMHPNDGRVVSNFIIQVRVRCLTSILPPRPKNAHSCTGSACFPLFSFPHSPQTHRYFVMYSVLIYLLCFRQALQNKPLTLYGAGTQTRSFQFVDDLVDGLEVRLLLPLSC
jgi:UDP-glucuronate decarboxylase